MREPDQYRGIIGEHQVDQYRCRRESQKALCCCLTSKVRSTFYSPHGSIGSSQFLMGAARPCPSIPPIRPHQHPDSVIPRHGLLQFDAAAERCQSIYTKRRRAPLSLSPRPPSFPLLRGVHSSFWRLRGSCPSWAAGPRLKRRGLLVKLGCGWLSLSAS